MGLPATTKSDLQEKNMKQTKVPHVFVILVIIAVIASISTYLIPSGQFDREVDANGRTIIVSGTYQEISATPTGFLEFFQAIFQGMSNGANIIFLLFIIGGSFGILQKTKALDGLISYILEKSSGKEIYIIPIFITFFALCGATYGSAEDSIVYIVILLPLLLKMGFDSIVAASIPLLGTAIGYTGSFLNPFNIGVAQGIAELPLFSGMAVRIVCFLLFLILGIGYIMLYAKKIKKDPSKSLMYDIDKKRDINSSQLQKAHLTKQHILILTIFGMILISIVVGVSSLGWYIKEISGLFLLMGILIGIIARMNANKIAESFTQGCKDMMEGALAVGFAYSIVVIFTESNVLDTIIYGLSSTVENLPSTFAALGMYGVQGLINYIVASGSGQAALTMPILTPLSDLVDVSRQTAVLAFQFGDGISNAFTPTAGWLIAGLALAGVPWLKWAKFILPLIIMQYILGAIIITIVHLFVWPA
ncbi:YfcC family protein [Fredinandcohnia onubensis]|uniref:YfcC family protein n=1 Tax=Fredinandcohnia onubensis TaxID=1571209 RepID=UPI000C0C0711|nr:AbgT family transporter [Fredinandcohnia onubensis]